MRRAVIAATVALVALGLWCGAGDRVSIPPPVGSDVALFQAVVDRVHRGEPYYAAMQTETSARGYPMGSRFAWRLPTLTWLEAALPSLAWSTAILSIVALVTSALWLRRFRGHGAMAWAAVILALPFWIWFSPLGVLHYDVWAGQLIGLSLAARANNFSKTSLAAGAAAVCLRELALPFVVVMLAAAIVERRRREAIGWGAIVALVAGVLLWHWHHVQVVMPADGLRNGWIAFGGWCFVLLTSRAHVLLFLAPAWVAAVAVPTLWAGLTVPDGAGTRTLAVASVFLLMFAIVGRPDNWYWGLLVTPVLPLGLLGLRPSAFS